jgi:5-methylthioadenosine/S-adenosylhomocysteine deaminase
MVLSGERLIKGMNESVKIIENGFVITGDKQSRSGQLTLLIQNGRIADIGRPAQSLKILYPDAEVINAADKVLLPGFIDAHHSGDSFLLRYLTSGIPFSRWNKTPHIQRVFEYLRKDATYEEFLSLYRLSYYSAVKSGVTTLAEYGIDNPQNSFSASLEAMQHASLRGFIGLHNGDQIEEARLHRDLPVHFGIVIADEENLTTYNLQSAVRSAQDLQCPIILHLGQTKRAFDLVKKNFNKSIARLYSEFRIFDYPVHLIHLACFEEGDFEIIAKSGASLIFSPSAIIQKGTEMPPFEEILKNKIPLALGTDWGAAKPLENIRSFFSILRTLGLPAEQSFRMFELHTKNSARTLGLENEIGTIEVGKKADIVFVNLSDFRTSPVLADDNAERVLDIMLQEVSSQNVSEVMINGEFYVREGHLLTYSEDDLINEGQILYKKLLSISGQKIPVSPSSASVYQLSPEPKDDVKLSGGDLPFEEGFKVVRKTTEAHQSPKKPDSGPDKMISLPKKGQKKFGEDEL